MHKGIQEATQFINALIPSIQQVDTSVFIAPAFLAIPACAQAAEGTNVVIGGQNMSDADEGPYTGEVSSGMLKEAGAQFVILGHSERRIHFHESDALIHFKLKRAILDELLPILCIGENKKERAGGQFEKVIKKQIDQGFGGLTSEEIKNVFIAYEPIWAIGTGKSATVGIAQNAHHIIRAHLMQKYDKALAEEISILYGGSVKPNNIALLLRQKDIDGVLVGGASLDAEVFSEMIIEGSK